MPLLNVDFNISLCLLCINVMVKDLLSRGLATSNKNNTNSKSSHTVHSHGSLQQCVANHAPVRRSHAVHV